MLVMACVEISPFDSDAFGHPFYRVHSFDPDGLRAELGQLPLETRVAVDAKVPASDVPNYQLLMALGFRPVAMMIHLTHRLEAAPEPLPAARIVPRLDLPEEVIWRHARNFRYDRFNLDPMLAKEGVARLFFRWITNSLTLGRQQVVHIGHDFCTFSLRPDGSAAIDLVSVLEHGKGTGKALVEATVAEARRLDASFLQVTTECQNAPAWNLYQRSGFKVAGFTAAMHLVRDPAHLKGNSPL